NTWRSAVTFVQKPFPQHWMNHTIGRSGFGLTSVASTWNSEEGRYDPELRAEFYVSAPEAHKYFQLLELDKAAIEEELGQDLILSAPSNKQTCKAYIRRPTNFMDRGQWSQQHEWLRENLEKFHRVFSPRMRQLDLSKASTSTGVASTL